MNPNSRNDYRRYIKQQFSVEDFRKKDNLNLMKISNNNKGINLFNSNNMTSNSNFLHQPKKNISEIMKLNYYTENQSINLLNQTNNQTTKLDFKLIESTTEDTDHPLRELLKGQKGAGWFSSKFCSFPQAIYVQFNQPVFLRQINMVIHEKNIPSKIKFYTYFPENSNDIIQNYHKVKYNYIGFIKMDNNERSKFRARESRKVYINNKSVFLKIEFDKNYENKFNMCNQVGLMNLDFYGTYLPPIGNNQKINQFILKHAVRKENMNNHSDQVLEDICGQELKDLKEKLDYNIKVENYLECKKIKMKLEKVRLYGKQILDLENQKKLAVNNEDFDQALNLKNLIDKMRENLKITINSDLKNNFTNDIENQIVGNNKFSQIGFNNNSFNNNNLTNNNINNNDSLFNNNNTQTNSFNITNEINNVQNVINESINTNTNYSNNLHQKIKSNEENFISYDDTILPAVLKRLNNESKNEEDEGGEEKGELEPISSSKLEEYQLIVDVIGEEGLRKLLSKQMLWKKEGFEEFIKKINDVLDYKVLDQMKKINNNDKTNITNKMITSIMKLSIELFEEKFPFFIIKTLEILKGLFDYIKNNGIKLNIDLNVTDDVLKRIKRKLGDANKNVRAKAVSLYCYMLTLDFCDYNNLISELLEEELRNYDSKYKSKPPNIILGKLEIFNNVFDTFQEAINSKRTSLDIFPSNLIMEYLILNVNHNKPEIRKLCRLNISKFIKIFGVNKIKKKLEKIDERELIKLINEIPSLEPYFPKLNKEIFKNNSLTKLNGSNGSNNSKGKNKIKNKEQTVSKIGERKKWKNNNINKIKNYRTENNTLYNTKNNSIEKERNKSEDKKNDKNKNKIKNRTNQFCDYCQRKMNKDEVITNHWITNCPMFTTCKKCNMNIEVKVYTSHKLKDCKFKNDFKECRTCHEVFSKEEYENHLRNKCGIKHGFIKCPLCHGDIPDNNKGFFQHLVKDGCPANKRK